ncbi:MAG: hypothetical protein M5U19_01255 [Microthrixaceae bacterium]|nr:hypothetical protein [Microthrixaceae bacterium]
MPEESAMATNSADPPRATAPLGPIHTLMGTDDSSMAVATSVRRSADTAVPSLSTCNTTASTPRFAARRLDGLDDVRRLDLVDQSIHGHHVDTAFVGTRLLRLRGVGDAHEHHQHKGHNSGHTGSVP